MNNENLDFNNQNSNPSADADIENKTAQADHSVSEAGLREEPAEITNETIESTNADAWDGVDVAEAYSSLPSIDLRSEKKTFSTMGWGLALFAFVSLLVSSIIMIVVSAVSPAFASSALFMHLVTPVSMYLFALPILLIFLSRIPATPPEPAKMRFGTWILHLLVGFGLMYIGAQVSNVVMGILTALLGYDPMNAIDNVVGNSNVWINLIFVVIIAPIGEEFVFRKLLIDRLKKYGCFVSALFSGVVFGLMHGNLYQCFYAFALGLLLGYIYYNTGKLRLVIAIHAAINLVSGVLAGLLSEKLLAAQEALDQLSAAAEADVSAWLEFAAEHGLALGAGFLFSLFQWGAIACAIVLPIVFRKRIVLEKGEVSIPRSRGFSTLFLNVGAIVMLSVYFLEIILSLLPS